MWHFCSLQGVQQVRPHNGAFHLTLEESINPQQIVSQLVHQDVTIEQFQIAVPTLDEIFIRAVSGETSGF